MLSVTLYKDKDTVGKKGDTVEILLSNSSDKPIYEQITSQIKEMIMKGELKPGEAMPSMRKLAKSLHVSVITTQRAYDDLQRDGFILTVPAKGTFVLRRIRTSFGKKTYAELKHTSQMPSASQEKTAFLWMSCALHLN